jgi:hypothetical protein
MEPWQSRASPNPWSGIKKAIAISAQAMIFIRQGHHDDRGGTRIICFFVLKVGVKSTPPKALLCVNEVKVVI